MTNRRPSDATELAANTAPAVKRKRRASCLGEQERRERKRAVDREAQRSLREKTKTHIADLERTIRILRDRDRSGATANLLSEIDSLRAENERLRVIIDSVKNVLRTDIAPRTTAPTERPTTNGGAIVASPSSSSNGHRLPNTQTATFTADSKPSLPAPTELPNSYDFNERTSSTTLVDLDGMNIMTSVHTPAALDLSLAHTPVEDLPTDNVMEVRRRSQVDMHGWEDNAATASWGPFLQEFFGDGWRCPSPNILHISAPDCSDSPTSSIVCPIWKKSNELFEKIYTSCSAPGARSLTVANRKLSVPAEAGLLYLGIKEGWANISDEWMQSPVLVILQQVDEFLFCRLPRMERLATAYKSFKLLKVRVITRYSRGIEILIHDSTTSTAPPNNSPKSPNGCAPA
ncbi:uncharacterized protein EKO05_0004530 [Ascochyta rabiei]|uniref:uncharacterized protein n=1 Tax=Didymella rabiei TaxID=5454 RepID=UPI00220D6BEF|nr:uncharacterized protein EKO05_0004530 [Ascochyta rabiei]UPX14038.1 hypothetical protein EKO05_0004530 [Ascochyta rabiei]